MSAPIPQSGGFWISVRCDLRQLPEVLGCGDEEELIPGAAWASEAQSSETEDAFEMGEQHLYLLSELGGDGVFLGRCDVARHLAGAFMD